MICLVIDVVCNTRPSHFWELATPPLWGHPSFCLIVWEVSPLYDYEDTWLLLIWFDMICYLFWARGRWLTYVSAPYLCDHYSVYIPTFLLLRLCSDILLHHNSVYQFCFVLLCFYICSLGFLSSAAFLFPAAGTQDSFGILGSSVESRSIVDLPFSFLSIWAYFGMLDIFLLGYVFIFFLWAYVGFCNVLSRDVHDLCYLWSLPLAYYFVCMFWYDTIMWYFSPYRVGVLHPSKLLKRVDYKFRSCDLHNFTFRHKTSIIRLVILVVVDL